MLETPGRRLLRSSFPPSRPLQTPDLSLNEAQAKNSPGGGSSITKAATHKISALRLQPFRDSSITEAVTHKTPALRVNPFRDSSITKAITHKIPALRVKPFRDSSIADIETLEILAFPPNPSYVDSPASAQKKAWRVQISERKKVLMIALAIALLVPSFIVIFEAINAIIIYKQAQDGIAHLQAVETIFHGSSGGGLTQYFDLHKLRQAQEEIDVAHADFASLSDKLDHDSTVGLLSDLWPTQVSTIRALGHIATDGTVSAQKLIKIVIDIAPSVAPAFQESLSQTNTTSLKPYLTPASFQEINQALDTIAPLVHDMNINARGLSLNSLPISHNQHQMLASLLPLLPMLDAGLSQEHEFRSALGWFLGIDGQRSFLVEPMDSAELRATGGFTGQFGELTLNGAHVGPLHLENIGKYEENHTAEGSPLDKTVYPKVVGQSAPAPYSEWWPIANFGLRDANLSADFPTSARIAMERYSYEFGKQVDGVLVFTPALIEQVLHVTGPITIPAYKETITEQNLENRLHYYQLNNTGIRQEEIVEHVDDPQVARKLFTQRVTSTLISTVTHLPINKLLPMASEMLHSMKSKDLQIYVTNPQLESLIAKYGSAASLDRSTSHDGLFIVQSNLSASKASQYVATAVQDTIALDDQGGATHHLQMTLDYQQKGDVYGFDTYYDYVRIYVPVNSRLLAGNGFDQHDQPFCGDAKSGYLLCQPDVYGDGSLLCSTPIELGYTTAFLNDPYTGKDHPLDTIGPPQNLQSDEAGRAMFGGWVVIPKNCTMKVTLSWYVPPMSKQSYSLLLQAQASVYAPLDLTIQPAQKTCVPARGNSLHFSDVMNGEDMTFTVVQQGSKCSLLSK